MTVSSVQLHRHPSSLTPNLYPSWVSLTSAQRRPHPYLYAGTPTWSPALEAGRSPLCRLQRARRQSEPGRSIRWEQMRGSGNTHMKVRRQPKVQRSEVPLVTEEWCAARWGGGMTYKHVYQPGTPWHRDIPALKCPPPPSLQEAESRPRRGPKLRVREGHTWGKGATEGGMSGGSPLRHDVYKLGIPL